MYRRLLTNLRGSLILLLIIFNVVFWFIPILVIAVFKLLIPVEAWQRVTASWLVGCAENWISGNKLLMNVAGNISWEVHGLTALKRDHWYLVVSNHQAWVDVVILQYVFNRRIPFLKFFIKQQLIWVPFLGFAWWALDMPFMRRYSKSFLAKNPEKKGQDLEATRRACEKFQTIPTSVINFVEGTRSSPEKIKRRGAAYRNLLRPRSGGIAFALGAMEGIFHELIDVTIVYPEPPFSFWNLCCGQLRSVVVDIRLREIPDWICEGDYSNDNEFRQRFHQWIGAIWVEKDALIEEIQGRRGATEGDSSA